MALGIVSPWEVKGISLSKEANRFYIYMPDFRLSYSLKMALPHNLWLKSLLLIA